MTSQNEDKNPEDPKNRKRSWSIFLVIVFMVTALILGPVSVLEILAPQHPWHVLILVIFFVAIESNLTTNWLHSRSKRGNIFTYRLAELVVITIFLRLLTWLLFDSAPDFRDFQELIINPFVIFDFFFIIFLLFSFLAWNRSLFFSGVFSRLSVRIREAADFARSTQNSTDSASYNVVPFDSSAILRDYYRGWIIGGVILVLAAAMTTIPLNELNQGTLNILNFRTINRLGMRPEIMLAIIVYFTAGLWLASQVRLASSSARWYMDGIEPERELTKRWGRTTLFILMIIGLIAAFLPIGSTLAISRLIQIIMAGMVAILGLLMAAFNPIFVFILRTLFGTTEIEESMAEPSLEKMTPPHDLFLQANDIPDYILGVLFWFTVIAVSIFALWFFFHSRGLTLSGLRISDFFTNVINWFRRWLRPALLGLHDFAADIRNRLEVTRPRQLESVRRINFFRLGSLSPREQVRFFYLSTIRRAGDKGMPRDKDRTPFEFSGDLKKSLPESSLDLDSLTDAFVKARYSQQNFEENELGRAKSIWKRLRTAIKKSKSLRAK